MTPRLSGWRRRALWCRQRSAPGQQGRGAGSGVGGGRQRPAPQQRGRRARQRQRAYQAATDRLRHRPSSTSGRPRPRPATGPLRWPRPSKASRPGGRQCRPSVRAWLQDRAAATVATATVRPRQPSMPCGDDQEGSRKPAQRHSCTARPIRPGGHARRRPPPGGTVSQPGHDAAHRGDERHLTLASGATERSGRAAHRRVVGWRSPGTRRTDQCRTSASGHCVGRHRSPSWGSWTRRMRQQR